MTILYRQSRNEIHSIQQLLDYINNTRRGGLEWIGVKFEKKPTLNQWIQSPIEVKHKKLYKEFRNVIGATSNRVFQLEYYLERGYSQQFAQDQVYQQQSKRSRKAWDSGKNDNVITTTHLEWWINKCNGDVDKARELYHNRQATFSKKRCIEQWGKTEGLKIFHQRQKLWQSNLNHNSFDTAVTFEKYLNKFNSFNIAVHEWFLLAVSKSAPGTTQSPILNEMLTHDWNSKDDVLNYLLNRPVFHDVNNSILSILNITPNQFKARWLKYNNISDIGKLPKDVCIYGNKYYVGDHYFESNLELELGLLLIESDIDFICHKQYPNSKRKYDFYLPKPNLYVEVTGMGDDNYKNKKNELNHINNIIWSNEPQKIYQQILTRI